jgi:Na+/glutamate symporter
MKNILAKFQKNVLSKDEMMVGAILVQTQDKMQKLLLPDAVVTGAVIAVRHKLYFMKSWFKNNKSIFEP